MIVMIFVNELAEVKGLPWWTYHAPGKVDAMTYVDMVFPAFLFILGMAIPLATEQRLARATAFPHFWLTSSSAPLALLVLGIILANAGAGDPALIHISTVSSGRFLALLGAMSLLDRLPEDRRQPSQPSINGLRLSGLVAHGRYVRYLPPQPPRRQRRLDHVPLP